MCYISTNISLDIVTIIIVQCLNKRWAGGSYCNYFPGSGSNLKNIFSTSTSSGAGRNGSLEESRRTF